MPTEFRNEPLIDFTEKEHAQAMRAAIDKVKSELGREYPLVIGGERIKTASTLESINPANRTQVVGKFHKATKDLANQAVETAYKAFQSWRNVPAEERAQLLFRVAELMRERKHEFSAWMVYEVAKTWPEADGDTAEAIDFLEFYAREMLRYASDQPLVKITGEHNNLDYIPLGVGAVIPPFDGSQAASDSGCRCRMDRGKLQEGRARGDAAEEAGGTEAGEEDRGQGCCLVRR